MNDKIKTAKLNRVGKVVRGDLYFHVSAAQDVSAEAYSAMLSACEIVCLRPEADFNVVKISREGTAVSLLSYADFFTDPFPSLAKVRTVNMTEKSFRERSYGKERNPPILHKKELLLASNNLSRPKFEELTQVLEERGIRPNKPGLGFRRQWEEYLSDMRVNVFDHEVVSK